MNQKDIVHTFFLAEQDARSKKLAVISTREGFFIKKIGRPCGDQNLASFDDVLSLREWIKDYK